MRKTFPHITNKETKTQKAEPECEPRPGSSIIYLLVTVREVD